MTRISQSEWIARLNPNHLDDLKRSGLSDEIIYEAKIRSATAEEASEILGFKIDCPCLLFPYYDLKTQTWGDFTRVKPDDPPIFEGKPAKYLTPKGASNRLYLLPCVVPELGDASIPLIITEGEKKCLKAIQEGFCCIGLSGVWCWVTREEEETTEEKKGEESHVTTH